MSVTQISHFRLHDELVKAIDEEIAMQAQPLMDGVPTDFSDYSRRVGVIRGLVLAQEIAEDVRKRLLES